MHDLSLCCIQVTWAAFTCGNDMNVWLAQIYNFRHLFSSSLGMERSWMRAPKVFDVRKGGVLSPDANKIVLFNWNLFTFCFLLVPCLLSIGIVAIRRTWNRSEPVWYVSSRWQPLLLFVNKHETFVETFRSTKEHFNNWLEQAKWKVSRRKPILPYEAKHQTIEFNHRFQKCSTALNDTRLA